MLWPGYLLAGVLLLLCAAAAGWALVGDRARGRRRCPRCFYSMAGSTGLTCPECGRTARSEQALLRTRRRWGRAVLAVALLLPPAIAAAGLTRLRQTGGWSDLPDWAVTRLLWLEDDLLREDVVGRIRAGELTRDQAARVVLVACEWLESSDAARRASGFDLLEGLARNSYVLTRDRPGALRPMLEELRPDRSVPIIVALADAGNERAIGLLSHLCDADEEANLALWSAVPTSSVAMKALTHQWRASDTVKRLPPIPEEVGDALEAFAAGGVPAAGSAVVQFSQEVAARRVDRQGLARWARGQVTAMEVGPPDRALALWFWCRLDRFGEKSLSDVKAAIEDPSPLVQATAIQHLSAFPWSTEIEAALRNALQSGTSDLGFAALDAIEVHGPAAAALIPDMLDYVRSEQRRGGSSSFVEKFIKVGGNPRDLLDALIDRIERTIDSNPSSQPPLSNARPGTFAFGWGLLGIDMRWLSALGLRDERGAAVARRVAETAPDVFIAMDACVAYAVLAGDKSFATRRALEQNPDLSERLFMSSPQETVLRLIRENLDDQQLIVAHFVDTDDPKRRLGFATLMSGYVPRDAIRRYQTALERLAADPDPAIAAPARKALGMLD